MRTRLSAFGSVLVVALTAGCGDAQNAIINPGFEDGLSGWDIKLQGDWVGRVDRAEIVDVSADARSGSKALRVSTEALNPGDEITDELRTWRRPKYEILVTQTVDGLAPESYHLARVHIKSPGIAIDEGFEVISDIKPWPLQTYGESREESHWSGIHAWERRLFLPQAPKVDGEYHECVLLKQLYATSDSLEVGIRIRAPWTGTVIIDDVELIPIDPENDVTPMEVLLGMRGAKPLSQVRELNRETTLVRDGESACAILAPETLADQARQVAARLKELAGASVPIASALDDVPAGASIIALGSVLNNDLVARLHFNRYARVDSVSPGPGGYVIWTVAEPYGLALKQNVVIVGGSDDVGQAAGAEAFCALLEADGDDVTLPFLHAVSPKPVIADSDRVVPRDDWGYKWDRERMSGFSRWFIQQWLRTGDLEI
ncbi:MAG TPA: hypothetical protein QGH10_05755, partial [Armatimonadota bacterium]|nr:hypothetical protein [Armatimonadota bacterium]